MAAVAANVRPYKIVLLGEPGVGKTTFILRVRNESSLHHDELATPSIGLEELLYKIGNTDIKVWLQDTVGGVKRFRAQPTSDYYRHANAAILMFSLEDRCTLQSIQEWYEEICQYVTNPDSLVWAVVGNKSDLPLDIEQESIEQVCGHIGTKLMFLTSAKTGEGVMEATERIIKTVHDRLKGDTVASRSPYPHIDGQTGRKCCRT